MSDYSYTYKQLATNVLVSFALAWLWVATMVGIMSQLGLASITQMPTFSAIIALGSHIPWFGAALQASPNMHFFMAVAFAPIVEEAFFRMFALELGVLGGKRVRQATLYVVCGLAFGLAHGHPINILIQGVLGLIAGNLYVRNGRHGMYHGYFSCVALHAAYNYAVIMNGG